MSLLDADIKGEAVASQFNPEGLSPFPFNLITTEKKDLEIFTINLEAGVSGAILFDQKTNKYRILINPNKPLTRQQFTIAHELGHYFLHSDIIKREVGLIDVDGNLDNGNMLFRQDEAESTIIEREANRFAAALIMPKQFVEKAWKELKSVEECAKVFNVSVSAMSIRLEKLGFLNH